MKVVGICACCSGIAHTYMAKEALMQAAQALGIELALETQGTIGVEDELTPEQIEEADCALLAVDVHVEGTDRFKDLPTMKIGTDLCIKAPKQVLQKVQSELEKLPK